MKRTRILILLLLAALLLCGCARKQSVYTVDVSHNGVDMVFTVDTENGTITDGQHTYSYEVSGSTTTITYPNGASYYETKNGSVSNMGWSNDYDSKTYIDGDTLMAVLSKDTPKANLDHLLLGLVLIALGAFNVFLPHAACYIAYGWRFKDAEPSDAALVASRVGGVVVAIIGLIVLFN